MDRIRDNIYLGSAKDVHNVKAPITAVLNVASEINDPVIKGIVNVKVAMYDTAKDVLDRTDDAVSELKSLLDNGHTVLVHCKQGKSRSPHIVAEYLSVYEKGDYYQIYKDIKKIRPAVLAYSIGQEILDKHLL